MNIGVDAGALCTDPQHRFGNYTLTKNLIDSLAKYDAKNKYVFCDEKDIPSQRNFETVRMKSSSFWMKLRVTREEFKRKNDIFLALNQAMPVFTKAKIISFSHGLSFYFHHDLYPDSYEKMMKQAREMIGRSRHIIVSSEKVAKEFKLIDSKSPVVVRPSPVPQDMISKSQIVKERKNYFLFVGMNHPIKNVEFLIDAFGKFGEYAEGYELKLVGDFKKYQNIEKGIVAYPAATRDELKGLYSEATAYLTASLYESCNLPVLEALAQNCPVIGLKSAIIPEFKEYVTEPESVDDFVQAMRDVTRRSSISGVSAEIIKKFNWENYITSLNLLYAD